MIVRFRSSALIACVAVLGVLALCTAPLAAAEGQIDWAQAKQHWSFKAPVARSLPGVKQKSWPKQRLDYFILSRLEQSHITPSAQADPRTLIRRVTYDLTGLPPTPEEVDSFVKESSSTDAYERLVERLLASPRFGERMASMWLPLARYAEDQAHQVGTDTKFFYPNAYLYRQWVVDSFNQDLPYDRFVKLQLAADKIQGTDKKDLAALGFVGLGPKYYDRGRLDVMADEWSDRVDTVTRTFLGLTVACARCHDHKYDPVTTHDYYALAGVFASTKMVNKHMDGTLEDGKSEAKQMRKDTLHMVEDDATAHDLNVFIRGNVDQKGPVVPRRFLQVLSDGEPKPFQEGSGRRELAEAIASPANPLTARVMVNRIWGLFFGNPLVSTPSNFGLIGDRPTHPELLDDLAVQFTKNGWSIKTLVRDIVLSSAYRQGSVGSRQSAVGSRQKAGGAKPVQRDPQAVDPTNRLLWRMNRRRMTVEQWRDGVLYVAGMLEAGGGPSMELSDPANHRRTLYARISRLQLNPILTQFDYPDANVHAEKRAVTTTPTQKLFLLNSPLVLDEAKAFATKLNADPKEADADRIRRAYQLLYSRAPSAQEASLGLAYLKQPESSGMSRWERYAQVLLMANEAEYLD